MILWVICMLILGFLSGWIYANALWKRKIRKLTDNDKDKISRFLGLK